jgi:hypothetical protein
MGERFEQERPVSVLAQTAVERLLSSEVIDQLFANRAQQQYQRSLLFSSAARLMASVVLGWQPSVNAAYKRMKEEVGVSLNALYGKLDRMEAGLSQALVRHSYRQLCETAPPPTQALVAGYHTKVLDGNHLAATEHRLLETRNSTAAPLPGKLLVVLDAARRAIADVFPLVDGHAQERSSLDPVIETIQPGELWLCDRNFCTLKLLYQCQQRDAKFAVRLHQQLQGERVGPRVARGQTATGRVYEQQLKLPKYLGQTLTVRCVEIELFEPTRDGETVITILTNLTVEEADACEVAEIYRERWTIETAFLHLTTTLQCEVRTLCYPKAAIFAFSLACVAYNAVQLTFDAIRAEHGAEKTESMSFYYVGLEIAQAHDGMMVAVESDYWAAFRELPPRAYFARLRQIAKHIDFSLYRKATRGPKKPKTKPKHNRREVHVSSARLLAARRKSAC